MRVSGQHRYDTTGLCSFSTEEARRAGNPPLIGGVDLAEVLDMGESLASTRHRSPDGLGLNGPSVGICDRFRRSHTDSTQARVSNSLRVRRLFNPQGSQYP
jgi:hypothetical protein